MKKIFFSILAIAALITFNSCNDDETPFDADADVLVLTRYSETGPPEFAAAYFVYANKSMQDVMVITPGGQQVELGADGNYTATFFKEPADEDYTSTPPTPGEYNFDILTEKNKEVLISDVLESNYVMPVEITSYTLEDNTLSIGWEETASAEAYRVRFIQMTDDGENVYFATNFIEGDTLIVENATSNINYQGTPPQPGEDYTIEVMAYNFEADAEAELFYNIQSISTARRTITWE